MSQARKEINALIKETFNVPLKGIEYQPFKFTMKTWSFPDLGVGDSVHMEFVDEQAFWNECHCLKMNDQCLKFKGKVEKINTGNGIRTANPIHYDPSRLEENGRLDCDLWLSERKLVGK